MRVSGCSCATDAKDIERAIAAIGSTFLAGSPTNVLGRSNYRPSAITDWPSLVAPTRLMPFPSHMTAYLLQAGVRRNLKSARRSAGAIEVRALSPTTRDRALNLSFASAHTMPRGRSPIHRAMARCACPDDWSLLPALPACRVSAGGISRAGRGRGQGSVAADRSWARNDQVGAPARHPATTDRAAGAATTRQPDCTGQGGRGSS